MKQFIKAMSIAVAVVLFVGLATFSINQFKSAKDTATAATNTANKLTNDMMEEDKTMYETTNSNGTDVVNAIRKFEGENIAIIVKNGAGNTTSYGYSLITESDGKASLGEISNADVRKATEVTSSSYINPNALFSGKVIKNKNDAIVGIKFTQK